uniref:Uncharacterized protein n=1 Tax=Oryza brachyantha TaxID=4533 RepID=J3LGT1_ORYBR
MSPMPGVDSCTFQLIRSIYCCSGRRWSPSRIVMTRQIVREQASQNAVVQLRQGLVHCMVSSMAMGTPFWRLWFQCQELFRVVSVIC